MRCSCFVVAWLMSQNEEGVGREQRRRADEATQEARKLSEELDTLKQARTSTGFSNVSIKT